MSREPSNLEELIDRIDQAASQAASGRHHVTFGTILDHVGPRSHGVMLLLAGLVTVLPVIGDIPGVPTIMGLFVLLTAFQLLLQRQHIWLPEWLLRRSTEQDKVCKALAWMRRPARFVDRFLRTRLPVLVTDPGRYAIAVVCILIALLTPAMELVPFSANGAGAALILFGLSLTAGDGFLALLGFIFTGITFGAIVYLMV